MSGFTWWCDRCGHAFAANHIAVECARCTPLRLVVRGYARRTPLVRPVGMTR